MGVDYRGPSWPA